MCPRLSDKKVAKQQERFRNLKDCAQYAGIYDFWRDRGGIDHIFAWLRF
jgi:hypothetical protein